MSFFCGHHSISGMQVLCERDNCPIWNSLEVPVEIESNWKVVDAITTIDGVKYRVRIEKEPPCSK